jgi:cation diffusion facilitator CzcD-associated flavoprotein CzcO
LKTQSVSASKPIDAAAPHRQPKTADFQSRNNGVHGAVLTRLFAFLIFNLQGALGRVTMYRSDWAKESVEKTQTVVVGAGPAGLAVSACLHKERIPHIVLEQHHDVGHVWREHYDRLCLHTPKATSALPYFPFPRAYPTYPSRRQVVEYLDEYATHFGIKPRFGQKVTWVQRRDGHWDVATATRRYRAASVVIATGYNAEPNQPTFPGLDKFRGRTLHSVEYRNAQPFRGEDVLVVGCGNSGAEIALDLCENGARVAMVVRGPTHVIPRDLYGLPYMVTSIALSRLPLLVADRLADLTLRAVVGDLSRYGIHRPPIGPLRQVEQLGRVPMIDIGTLAEIKKGRLAVMPAVASFNTHGARFTNGREKSFDTVIFATGYKPRLDRFLEGADRLTNERGYPKWHGREAGVGGLFFTGFRNPPTGMLREINLEAKRIAADLRNRSARRDALPTGDRLH